jgi:mono/diheme cytochrome c family protein
MRNFFRNGFTSILFLVSSLLIITVILSACGSPTTEATAESEIAQEAETPTASPASTPEVSAATDLPTAEAQVAPASSVSYSKDVYPIFEASCIKCHGVDKVSRGLDLTSYEKTMTGSVKGPVVLPGDADNSPLVKLSVEGKMPKQGAKLTPEQIEIVRNWVLQGALNN